MAPIFIGIDVGTGSARAGVFDATGTMLSSAKRDIAIWREAGEIVEQSSDDIWRAVCEATREAVAQAGVPRESVAGVGFDATCSLVVSGDGDQPLSVSHSGDPARNIIVWMDHRATRQAQRINATKHQVLDYVGGVISPEMETPKLLWLAENLPETFAHASAFLDLTDFLTWKASGSLARSSCTVTCKWTYLAHEKRWDESYFRLVGLGALADEGFARIGTDVVPPGTALGRGLTDRAATELGLKAGTAVAAGLIDAHAGGIGTVGALGAAGTVESRMAYVFGTSACTMSSTTEPAFVPGVWGPYYSAMVPGLWLNEGGQSAAGAAIDHLVRHHPAAAEAAEQARSEGITLTALLSREAEEQGGAASAPKIIGQLHVVPEFLGNRAPFADPDARGVIAGMGMDFGRESLIALYLAGMCGLGYGVRQIVQAEREKGLGIDTIVVSGGAGASRLARQVLADATGLQVAASTCPEPVLLGSAIIAAAASGRFSDIRSGMQAMSSLGEICSPDCTTQDWHEKRFQAFQKLQEAGRMIR